MLSPLASTDLSHPNWNPSRHCCVVVCLLFFVWVAFVCVVFWFVWFLLLFLCVSVFVCSPSDKGIGLCIGPLPVYFCGPTARPLRELTN